MKVRDRNRHEHGPTDSQTDNKIRLEKKYKPTLLLN